MFTSIQLVVTPLDIDKLMKSMKQELHEEIVSRVRDTVEQQYCPTHGEFAQFVGVDGNLAQDEELRFEFKCCCDALQAKVEAELQASGE